MDGSITGRRARRAVLALGCALSLTAGTAHGATVGGFEGGDGDQTAACTASVRDWQCLTAGELLTASDSTGLGDDVFASGKEEAPDSWVLSTTASVPSKTDFQAVWTNLTGAVGGHTFMNLAFKRVDGSGDTYLGVELNQSRLTFVNTAGDSVPCRRDGDVLISYFAGSSPSVTLYRWDGTAGPASCPDGGSGNWVAPVVTDGAQAAVNLSTITNTLSTGTLGTSFGPQTFGEAGLDLTAVADAVQYPNTACEFFRQVTVKSRKSSSIAAELADYVHAQDVVARSCETPGGTGGGGTGGGGTGGGGTGGGGTGGGGGTPPGDTTAPDAPSFDGAINGATSCSGNIVLGGLAEPNSVVTVYDGTAPVSDFAVADALGAWTLTISGAATGAHVYTAEATDSSGNTSGRTAPATVTVGGCAPGQSGTPGVDPGPPVPGGGSTGDGTGSGSGSGTTDPGATPPTGSSDPAPVVAGQPTGTSSPLGAIAADTGALDGFLLGNHPATASGCQLKTFKAYVRRKSGVRKVVFRVDGKQVAVDRKPDKKGQFIGVIKPSKLKAGPHILTGTIIFKAKGHKPKVLTLRFRKCDQCQSRRAITVHPRGLHKGERAVSAKIYLNGKLYRSVKGAKKLGAKIVLKGMSKGVQKVRIVAKTNQGRTIVDHRKFKTCTKKTASTKKKT